MEAYLSDEKTVYWNDNPTIPNKHFPLKPWDIGYVVEVTEHKTDYRFMGFLFLSDIDNDIFCQYEDLQNRHFANKSWINRNFDIHICVLFSLKTYTSSEIRDHLQRHKLSF